MVCEGYRKDFKWRTFAEESFGPRPTTQARKNGRSSSFATSSAQPRSIPNDGPKTAEGPGPANTWSPGLSSAFASAAHAFRENPSPRAAEHQDQRPVYPSPDSLETPSYQPAPGNFPDALDLYRLPDTTRSSSANGDGSGQSLALTSPAEARRTSRIFYYLART